MLPVSVSATEVSTCYESSGPPCPTLSIADTMPILEVLKNRTLSVSGGIGMVPGAGEFARNLLISPSAARNPVHDKAPIWHLATGHADLNVVPIGGRDAVFPNAIT